MRRRSMWVLAVLSTAGCTGGDETPPETGSAAARPTAAAARPATDTTRVLWLLAPPGVAPAVGPMTSERDLVAAFGAANVRHEDIQIGEGETNAGTVLFPDDSTRRLEILWADTVRRDHPVHASATGRAWVAHPGIRLGSTLAEVERANGRPFTMAGFSWDYEGTVISWDGGRLDSLPAGAGRLLVRFSHPRTAKLTDVETRQVSGDRPIPSSNAIMQRIQPTVYALQVRFR